MAGSEILSNPVGPVSRKYGPVNEVSSEVRFVSLANNFTFEFSKLLKLPSGMENKTA